MRTVFFLFTAFVLNASVVKAFTPPPLLDDSASFRIAKSVKLGNEDSQVFSGNTFHQSGISGAECVTNSDCDDTQKCTDGECVSVCTPNPCGDQDCFPENHAAKCGCTATSCNIGYKCENKECKPCKANEPCGCPDNKVSDGGGNCICPSTASASLCTAGQYFKDAVCECANCSDGDPACGRCDSDRIPDGSGGCRCKTTQTCGSSAFFNQTTCACEQCGEGSYADEAGGCTPCSANCKYCFPTRNNTLECTICKSGYVLKTDLNITQSSVSECLPECRHLYSGNTGYYLDLNSETCKKCPENCLYCGLVSYGSTYCQGCVSGYHVSDDGRSCEIDDPCANVSCSGGKSCNNGSCVCPSGMHDDGSGTCVYDDLCANVACSGGKECSAGVCSCPSDKPHWNGYYCRECTDDSHCGATEKCNTSSYTCVSVSCANSVCYTISNHSCQKTDGCCVQNSDCTGTNQKCDTSANKCVGKTCTDLNLAYSCGSKQDKTFVMKDGNGNSCYTCSDIKYSCSDYGYQTSCGSKQNKTYQRTDDYGNSCYTCTDIKETCADKGYAASCPVNHKSIGKGYDDYGTACYTCSPKSCSEINSSYKTSCASNEAKVQATLDGSGNPCYTCTPCSSGYYANGNRCSPCSDALAHCLQCSSSSTCTQCADGYKLSGGKCVVAECKATGYSSNWYKNLGTTKPDCSSKTEWYLKTFGKSGENTCFACVCDGTSFGGGGCCSGGKVTCGGGATACVTCCNNRGCSTGSYCKNAGTVNSFCTTCSAGSTDCNCPSGQVGNGSGGCKTP